MATISLIAAMAKNRTIGARGTLPWHIKKDLKYFKEQTLGKPMVMGRKTFQSFNEKPLPKRPHFIVTRDRNYKPLDVNICYDLQSAIDLASMISHEVMVIGGGEIYKAALKLCDKIYLTEVEIDIEGDTFFPEFSKDEFKEVSRIPEQDGDIKFDYVIYERIKPA